MSSLDVTAALLEAAADASSAPEEQAAQRCWGASLVLPSSVARALRRGAELLRLHLHFARNPAAVASVLRAQGPLWAVTALQRFKPGHRTHEPALELLTALAAYPEALPALVGPTQPAWPAASRGAQRLSAALAAARRAAAESAGVDAPLRVTRVHCGGRGASSRARLAVMNDDDALLQQLRARCDADADGIQQPPLGDTVRLRPVPADDPRTGLAGVGNAAYAVRALPARAVVGPYSAWVTTPDEFDEHVAVRERAEYEAHAVTTETPLELEGIGSSPLMFVAHPPSVADATCELNDWRVAPADKEREQPGDGPNCELVEVEHRGWRHVFVVVSRAVSRGTELTVEYPRGFWRGRARAMEAYAAADAAIDAGLKPPRSKKARQQ